MKQVYLFRLFAITIFCVASLAIKSESSSYKSICKPINKDKGGAYRTVETEGSSSHHYRYNAFFIRI